MELYEWVDKNKNKITLNNKPSSVTPTSNTSSNYQDQTDKYKKLIAKIDTDKICKYTVNELTDRILSITADTKFKTGLKIKIVYKPYVPCYLIQVNEP